jgi:hypothetical protein
MADLTHAFEVAKLQGLRKKSATGFDSLMKSSGSNGRWRPHVQRPLFWCFHVFGGPTGGPRGPAGFPWISRSVNLFGPPPYVDDETVANLIEI